MKKYHHQLLLLPTTMMTFRDFENFKVLNLNLHNLTQVMQNPRLSPYLVDSVKSICIINDAVITIDGDA